MTLSENNRESLDTLKNAAFHGAVLGAYVGSAIVVIALAKKLVK